MLLRHLACLPALVSVLNALPSGGGALTVERFLLRNCADGSLLETLRDSQVLELDGFLPVTIEAIPGAPAGSIRLSLSGPGAELLERLENSAPFLLGGDREGTASPVPLPAGDYLLRATAYSGPQGSGESGPEHILRFRVVRLSEEPGPAEPVPLGSPILSGALQLWHRVTLTFPGPAAEEAGEAHPFRDHRLEVEFHHLASGTRIVTPGFFAADGDAAESGAEQGDRWRAHFLPGRTGMWEARATLRRGRNVFLLEDVPLFPESPAIRFQVEPSAARLPDLRARGLLRHTGGRYLQFAGDGSLFLKGGADSPENFLAYEDFDGAWATKKGRRGQGEASAAGLHAYLPHRSDWREGDPQWRNGKGRGIVGAVNYLASQGMNSVYFVTYNLDGGDGGDVWPWTGPGTRDRFDCSKLDQWEIVFSHMQAAGLALHVVLQEQENDQGLDGGELGPLRRLYLRELAARFAHHPALVWNLGEENTNTDAQRRAMAEHLRALDPYDHPIVLHTFPEAKEAVYGPLLGFPHLDGPSLQMGDPSRTHEETLRWVQASQEAGRPWFVCHDEAGPPSRGIDPDVRPDGNQDLLRSQVLWGNLMAGGAGVEWYFGYENPHNDLDCEDWRSRARVWAFTRHALDFFQRHLPFAEMEPRDALLTGADGYCLAAENRAYAVYLPRVTESAQLDLRGAEGTYAVWWFDPARGGPLQPGSVASVTGGDHRALGYPPARPGADWAALIRRMPELR